jgi:hypothetical protein
MCEPTIEGGSFMVARRIFWSHIWSKHPLYLKVWIWILGRASHSTHEKDGHVYSRGEFTTTYREIIGICEYRRNRQRIIPTLKRIRVILEWLQKEKMIDFSPISPGQTTGADSGAGPKELTKSYLGIKIIVVNYDTYQRLESYRGRPQEGNKGRHNGRPPGHDNNNGVYKNGLKETLTDCDPTDHEIKFLEFWKSIPARNGKKLNKVGTFENYKSLKKEELELCNQSAINYANSELVQKSIGIVDPERFLIQGRGKKRHEPWRDWITPETNKNYKKIPSSWADRLVNS